MISNLRRISVIEAVSYLVLLAATITKRAGGTEVGVTIFGPIHGVLFLGFAGMILLNYKDLGWPFWKAIAGIFMGSLPLGGFYIDQSWLKPLQR